MKLKSDSEYIQAYQKFYDDGARQWSVSYRDAIVGSFDQQNAWKDYDDFLFKGVEDTENKIALDIGTGPGRNIVKFNKKFKQIDGVDISQVNLDNATIWCKYNKIQNMPILYKNNGADLADIPSNYYNVIFSTIAFQHICIYSIRYNFLKDCFRALKSGGDICIQMGFGPGHSSTSGYYEDCYDCIPGASTHKDVKVDSADQIKGDLYKIGFTDFNYNIRPTGPVIGYFLMQKKL
jgi:ubiquinone/menaquinone biosynthesis C-methylase UbiE